MERELTANPMTQAMQSLKQPPAPKPARLALPKQRKRSQFFGE
jgi:hypothetical protein